MRLVELDPRWVAVGNWTMGAYHEAGTKFFENPTPFYIGVNFRCPHCSKGFVGALFTNPIDPGDLILSGQINWSAVMAALPNYKFWTRVGDTFETLSLSPSIDVSKAGHWHGSVTKGEVS